MKIKLLILFLFLFCTFNLKAQSNWPPPFILTADPSGACANGTFAFNITAGTGFFCSNNIWNSMAGSGGSPTFDTIGTGVNTTATMTCGTGCDILTSGSGSNAATTLNGYTFTSPNTIGSVAPNSGAFTSLVANQTGTGVAATFTGDSHSNDILDLNLNAGSGGNGFKFDSTGNFTAAGKITAGSGGGTFLSGTESACATVAASNALCWDSTTHRLQQSINAAAFTGITTEWSNLINAAGALTLANGTNNSTFNQTSAATWLWANTTNATSGTAQSSPIWDLKGQCWTGAATSDSHWTIQNVITNGSPGPGFLTFTLAGCNTSTSGISFTGFTGPIKIPNSITSTSATALDLVFQGGIDTSGSGTKLGAVTFRGGKVTGGSGAGGAGDITINGGDTASSSTSSIPGTLTIRTGRQSGATAGTQQGLLVLTQTFGKGSANTTGLAQCLTGDWVVADCGTSDTNPVGVAIGVNGNAVDVQIAGVVTVNIPSASPAVAKWVCTSTLNAGTNNIAYSATICAAGQKIGTVIKSGSSVTSVLVLLSRN